MHEFLDGKVLLYPGDCMEVLAAMPENSVDAVVCDPPYHLTSIVERFGKTSESDDTKTSERSRNRSDGYARLAAGGFMGKQWDGGDIAFQVDTWRAVQRVLKPGGYLLAFASTRGFWRMCVAIEDAGFITHPMIAWVFGSGFPKATRIKAEGYDGFRYGGQALKPAIEPIFMGQKPFSEATGTANILKHGTGAVNIDGCRIATGENLNGGAYAQQGQRAAMEGDERQGAALGMFQPGKTVGSTYSQPDGRWPANLIHDGSDEVVALFPDTDGAVSNGKATGSGYGEGFGAMSQADSYADNGSASRFFYSSKADSDDRIGSKHPTVKPVDLMRYLVRLVTPPGGIVLDPFAGTGTTGEAAWREGMRAALIEREPEYQHDIAERMRLCRSGPDEKKREIIKRKGLADDAGPLFGGRL